MTYDPSLDDDFGTIEHDYQMLGWLDESRSSSDLTLLAGWARARIEGMRKEITDLKARTKRASTTDSQIVMRQDDMSTITYMSVHIAPDGDMILEVLKRDDDSTNIVSVEFCNPMAGGDSPHTYEALKLLFEAMRKDAVHEDNTI